MTVDDARQIMEQLSGLKEKCDGLTPIGPHQHDLFDRIRKMYNVAFKVLYDLEIHDLRPR